MTTRTHARSNRGSARAAVLGAVSVTAVAAILALLFLRPHDARVAPAPPASQPAMSKELPPPPAEVRKPLPPEPRVRTPRHAPSAAPPAAPEPAAAAPVRGTLQIDSDVPGASIFIDRAFIGTAPATAKDIIPGRHQLNASAAGYDGISDAIDVQAGEKSLTVRFKEVRLDAAIDVIHKHGIGSCRGRLVASPEGIRYVSTSQGDAFTAPLTSVDEFSVDYLKKNLRLKVKGRTYNFTDPDENADRLFVFHREVEKARQKLAVR